MGKEGRKEGVLFLGVFRYLTYCMAIYTVIMV